MLILLIYCAGWAAVPSGDFEDTDSEYLANENEDYNTVNNKGSETSGDSVDTNSYYFTNDNYNNTVNSGNTTTSQNPQTSACVITGGPRSGANCVFPFRYLVRIARIPIQKTLIYIF